MTPPAWSYWSSGCGPTPPTPCATSPSQNVAAKVISGDNAVSVGAVAGKLGLTGATPVDARTLPDDQEALADALDEGTVVRPGHPAAEAGHGGRAAVARSHGGDDRRRRERRPRPEGRRHRRGDGLGRRATRAVAQIVLLNNSFATLPPVVAEGRRVIGNITRVATLFLVKTVYSVLLALPRRLSGVLSQIVDFDPFRTRSCPGT